jgi:putative transposase
MPRRRSIRLPDYDYTADGAYFVTICSYEKECIFGEIVEGKMILNEWGTIAQTSWSAIPDHFPNTVLDVFVIMPNHVHGIIIIDDRRGLACQTLTKTSPQPKSS